MPLRVPEGRVRARISWYIHRSSGFLSTCTPSQVVNIHTPLSR